MCALSSLRCFFATAFPLQAGLAGFEVGNGVALTGGVVRVNYLGSKSHSLSLGPATRLSLMEVQLTMADGKVKRQTMLLAGTHALRAPLPIEIVEVVIAPCLLALLCGIALALKSRLGRAGPDASLGGDWAEPPGEAGGS